MSHPYPDPTLARPSFLGFVEGNGFDVFDTFEHTDKPHILRLHCSGHAAVTRALAVHAAKRWNDTHTDSKARVVSAGGVWGFDLALVEVGTFERAAESAKRAGWTHVKTFGGPVPIDQAAPYGKRQGHGSVAFYHCDDKIRETSTTNCTSDLYLGEWPLLRI